MGLQLTIQYFILLLFVQGIMSGPVSSTLSQPAEPDVFEGYSCTSNEECMHDGACINTNYNSSLCNCTESWLGPNCQFSAPLMKLELSVRPIVSHAFHTCINFTGNDDNVYAGKTYEKCDGGDVDCWLREGGPDPIKVFFWCLGTDYSLLMSEGELDEETEDNDSSAPSSSKAPTMLNGFEVISPTLKTANDEIVVFASPKKPSNPDVEKKLSMLIKIAKKMGTSSKRTGGKMFGNNKTAARKSLTSHPLKNLTKKNGDGIPEYLRSFDAFVFEYTY